MRSGMRRLILLISIVVLPIAQQNAFAEPPPGFTEYQEKLILEACILSSEKPHISEHVPGAVNVTGRTVCKGISGDRALQVNITLTRVDGGNTRPITKSKRGIGSVIVNVSMGCIWQSRQALIRYRVVTVHKLSNGKSRTTMNEALLKC